MASIFQRWVEAAQVQREMEGMHEDPAPARGFEPQADRHGQVAKPLALPEPGRGATEARMPAADTPVKRRRVLEASAAAFEDGGGPASPHPICGLGARAAAEAELAALEEASDTLAHRRRPPEADH